MTTRADLERCIVALAQAVADDAKRGLGPLPRQPFEASSQREASSRQVLFWMQ